MTEVEIYQPPATNGHAVVSQMDSWIAVASDVIKIAKVIHDTPFVPDGLRGSEPAVAAAILAGRELGLGPMTSLANIHVIKGKPSLAAVLMRALIQGQGHDWQDGHVSDTSATVRGRRKGQSEWTEVTFTSDQAKRAGIDLGKWPQDKLYARATSRLARRKFADVIAGMPYSSEELEDGPDDVVLAGESYHPLSEAGKPASEEPKTAVPRTAQRRQRAAEKPAEPVPTPAPPAGDTAPTDGPATAQPAPAGLPPLPDEEEPDYDTPGTVGRDQLTAMWATFSSDLGFTKDDKAQAREVCEKIIGRKLAGGTTGDLSRNEASMCIDTLKRCGTRERLIVLMNDGELPDGEASDG